jgi:hypothetical protein
LLGNLPLAFQQNAGQGPAGADYVAQGQGYNVALSASQASVELAGDSGSAALTLGLVGSNTAAIPLALDKLSGTVNYLIGNDPSDWLTDIATSSQVEYQDVYAGIDLVYDGSQGNLEYDFTIAPGADPNAIRLNVAGAQSVSIDPAGDLVIDTPAGPLVEQAPTLYQNTASGRQTVEGGFVVEANGQIGFQVGSYDQSIPLVIDPTLIYSTYLGGSGTDAGNDVKLDSSGNIYVTGSTNSPSFAGQTKSTDAGSQDVFVAKLNSTGTVIDYLTYIGGSGTETAAAIALDSSGDAYVTGSTTSTDLPTTTGAVETTYGGGSSDGFVAKLNAAGSSIAYATYLGGSSSDAASAIAVDSNGNAYVVGETESSNFPTSSGSFQSKFTFKYNAGSEPDGFITELNSTGAEIYSSFFGGDYSDLINAVAVDSAGDAFIAGTTTSDSLPTTTGAYQASKQTGSSFSEGFVAEVAAGGASLAYCTYLATGIQDSLDAIAIDSSDDVFVAGETNQQSIANYHGLVDELPAGGKSLGYSVLIGSPTDYNSGYTTNVSAIALDSSGNAFVTGSTNDPGLSVSNALQTSLAGTTNAFVGEIASAGTVSYLTYLGGSGSDAGTGIALDGADDAFVVGQTTSTNFPTASALQSTYGGSQDAFLSVISLVSTLIINGRSAGDSVSVTFSSATAFSVTVNGTTNSYTTSQYARIEFDGVSGGSETVIYDDTFNAYAATMSLGSVAMTATGIAFQASNATSLYVYAGSASTAAVDTPSGSNFFVGVAKGNYDYLYGGGVYSEVSGFGSITASGAGGTTYAYLYSATDAKIDAVPGGISTLTDGSLTVTASDFPQLYSVGASDGTDSITLNSEGNRFVGTPTFSYVTDSTFSSSTFTYLFGALYFATVDVVASSTTDSAYFDSYSGNAFSGSPTLSELSGSDAYFNAFTISASGFDSATVAASGSGTDTASLSTSSTGTFVGTSTYSTITAGSSTVEASGYSAVSATGTSGSTAYLYDAAGSNSLTASGTTATLATATASYTVGSFGTVVAEHTLGTTDTKSVGSISFTLTYVGTWTG